MRCRQCRYMWEDKRDASSVGICGGINETQAM